MGNEETRFQDSNRKYVLDALVAEAQKKKQLSEMNVSCKRTEKLNDRISRSLTSVSRSRRSVSRSRRPLSRSRRSVSRSRTSVFRSRRSVSRSRKPLSRSRRSMSRSRSESRSRRSHTRSPRSMSGSRKSQRTCSKDGRSGSLKFSPPYYMQAQDNMEFISNEVGSPEYYCKDCDCYATGEASYNQHLLGKQHLRKTSKGIKGWCKTDFIMGPQLRSIPFACKSLSKSKKRKFDSDRTEKEIIEDFEKEYGKVNSNKKGKISCMEVTDSEVNELDICDKRIDVCEKSVDICEKSVNICEKSDVCEKTVDVCEKSVVCDKETVNLLDKVGAGNIENGEENTNLRKLCSEKDTESGQCNIVGLDYVLVIHKHGKSWFQCFLCDTRTLYENPQQLKDHVLGVSHQRSYVVELHKGPIKIKRLKSRIPEKRVLDRRVEQKLFYPGKTTKPKFDINRRRHSTDSGDSNSTFKKKSIASNFLKRTMEQVHHHNRIYEEKLRLGGNRERSLSLPGSETDSKSKASTPPRMTARSSFLSLTSLDDMSLEGGPISPQAGCETPSLVELVEKLSVKDVLKLVLLKLKNDEVTENDVPYLNEVVEAALLKSTLQKEKLDEKEPMKPQPPKIDFDSCSSTVKLLSDMNSPFEKVKKIEVQSHCESVDDVSSNQTMKLQSAMPGESAFLSSSPTKKLKTEKSLDGEESKSPLSNQKIEEEESRTPSPVVQVIDICSDSSSDENVTSTVQSTEDPLEDKIQQPDSFWESIPTNEDLFKIVNILKHTK